MDLDLPSSLIDRTFILLNSQSGALETVDPGLLVIYSLLLVVLIIGSALVSGSEVAFFSLSHNEFAQLEQEEGRRAKAILKLKEIPRTLLATILIANNFINIAIVLISDLIVELSLGDTPFTQASAWLSTNTNGLLSAETWSNVLSNSVTIVGVTFILVLFGEITPKVYAQVNKMQLAKFMAQPLVFMVKLFKPLSSFLERGSSLIERRLEARTGALSPSREEIDRAIELTVVDDMTGNSEIDILKRIVAFGDVSIKQIMTARVDVIAIDVKSNFHEILDSVRESGYSRLPVFEEDFDKITGILYAKDLLPHLEEGPDFDWHHLVRDNLIFAPEAKKINIMLKEFQSSRMHLAIVVDEYGGTLGIITLEDILEEVIGDIKDEFDDEIEVVYQKLDKNNFIFEGKTLLNDIYKILEIDSNYFESIRGEADSIAGLILEIAKTIPTINTEFRFRSFVFKVISVDKKRIKEVKITKL